MIHHHSTHWKHTVALRVVFDIADSGLHEEYEGLLHFAEHLMFVATKKYKQYVLYKKRMMLFDVLDAYTSRNAVVIDAVFHKKDIVPACEVLHEMIYAWQCTKAQFEKEKTYIMEEWDHFQNETEPQAAERVMKKINRSRADVIGTKNKLRSLCYSDLDAIKKAWGTMLQEAPRHIILASGSLNTTQKKQFQELLDKGKSNKQTIQKSITLAPEQMRADFLALPRVNALVFETKYSSLFFIILQRLYYVRWMSMNPAWGIHFHRETGYLMYLTFQTPGQRFDKKAAERFLTKTPTPEEFAIAKNIVNKHVDSLKDGINPAELLQWLDTFHVSHIPKLEGKSLDHISKTIASYSLKKFLEQWKNLAI